jgi:hypothetical protein
VLAEQAPETLAAQERSHSGVRPARPSVRVHWERAQATVRPDVVMDEILEIWWRHRRQGLRDPVRCGVTIEAFGLRTSTG